MTRNLLFGLIVLAVLVVLFVTKAPAQVVKNCSTRQCVEIAFVPDKGGVNTKCLINFFDFKTKTYDGLAYSAQYAKDDCYGQDSKGGKSGAPKVMGNRRACKGTSDCGVMVAPPVSGTVSSIDPNERPVNETFNTKCVTGT